MLNILRRKETSDFTPDRNFIKRLKEILGFTPRKYQLYKQALTHKSATGRFPKINSVNNERLEFLGDAVLDSIVSEHLYQQFPDRDEGFLTQMRSKIVNRDMLKRIAVDMGLDALIIANMSRDNFKALYGDTLEAIIGASFIDRGYKTTRSFVLKKILDDHINLMELCNTEVNFKSKIIEWGQKNKKDINFACQEQLKENDKIPVFVSHLLVFDDIVGMGIGKSKKEAEQAAARQAIQILRL